MSQPEQQTDAEIRDQLERIERKPPLYRAFRVTLYTTYVLATLWLVGSIALAAWQSVYGEPGEALKQRQAEARGVVATPDPKP